MASEVETESVSSIVLQTHGQDLEDAFDVATASAVPLLSEGFAANFMPILEKVDRQLRDLEENQKRLLEQIEETNESVERDYDLSAISSTLAKIPQYQNKLQKIRSTMLAVQSRSKNLQRRAAQLRATRQEHEAQMEVIRRREQAHDQVVAARVAVRSGTLGGAEPAAAIAAVTTTVVRKKGKTKSKRREVEIEEAPTK